MSRTHDVGMVLVLRFEHIPVPRHSSAALLCRARLVCWKEPEQIRDQAQNGKCDQAHRSHLFVLGRQESDLCFCAACYLSSPRSFCLLICLLVSCLPLLLSNAPDERICAGRENSLVEVCTNELRRTSGADNCESDQCTCKHHRGFEARRTILWVLYGSPYKNFRRPSAKHCASAPAVFAGGCPAVSSGPLDRQIADG